MRALGKSTIRAGCRVWAGLALWAGMTGTALSAETVGADAAVSNRTARVAVPAPPADAAKSAVVPGGMALSPEQRVESARILQKRQAQIRKATQAAGAARRALFEAIQAEPFDEAAIRKAAKEAAQCEEELSVVRGLVASELRAILTPEQKKAMQNSIRDVARAMQLRAETTGSLVDAWVEENKP